MPRDKKPPGQAVDRRNGKQVQLVGGAKVHQPDMPRNMCAEARKQWHCYWDSMPAKIQTEADRGVVIRWIKAVDRYLKTIAEADRKPLVPGSTKQLVVNPLYKIAQDALSTVEHCEKQLGIGALNRAGLGIAVITEQKSLAEMNAQYSGVAAGDVGDDDPRITG